MNTRYQLMCVWSGVAVFLLFGIGLWPIAGFFPPLLPSASAGEIAAIYQQNTTAIRAGMLPLIMSGGFYAAWVAVISIQMRRIEGAHPVMAYTQMIAGAATLMFFLLSPLIWTTAAFRPERAIELTQGLNDLGWIMFVMAVSTGIFQNLAIGFAILGDKGPRPLFPRWAGFFNFWVAVLTLPGLLLTFFKTGPFAWNGLLAFYLPAGVFFLWFFVMIPLLIKAIKRQ